jgi:energy-coupling factor transporter transmembrane protein EcfT
MKELIAFLVFFCISCISIYLLVIKKIDSKILIVLLVFAIISGFTIANYDIIKKVKFGSTLGSIEVETAKKEIFETKETALKEISSEVKGHEESIRLLISNANDTKDKIENLIKIATDLENNIEEQKREIIEINKFTENTKKEIETLNTASAQIALILVRATYFTIETKSEFGTSRAEKAIQEIMNDLNKILPMVISDNEERAKWIKDLQNVLPPRK